MSDNQKIRRRLRCPNCGSLDVIKWGIRNGIQRHKAGGARPLGVACAACFEELAGVFASSGALHYAKILASLKIKNAISLMPLNCGQKNGCFLGRRVSISVRGQTTIQPHNTTSLFKYNSSDVLWY